MKKSFFLTILLSVTLFFKSSDAQVNINVNIGSQPQWGPVGYKHVSYYYLPDIESYYYVPTHQFVYLQHGKWIFANSLPYRYRNYNLYSGYKVVLNSPRPYHHFHDHRIKYKKFKGYHHHQNVIKYNKGSKNHIAYKSTPYKHVNYKTESNRGNNDYKSHSNSGKGNNGKSSQHHHKSHKR